MTKRKPPELWKRNNPDDGRPKKPMDLEFPGMVYRQRQDGWTIWWQPTATAARTNEHCPKATRLWPPDNAPLYQRQEPTIDQWGQIAVWCQSLYAQSKNPKPPKKYHDGTLGSLIEIYETHSASPYLKKRWESQRVVARELRALKGHLGQAPVLSVTYHHILTWQNDFLSRGESAARALISRLRSVVDFGTLVLPRTTGCHDLLDVFNRMRGKMMFLPPPKRTVFMRYDQAVAIIQEAHASGWHSVALAQACQFDLGLRQKDVIGEWVPVSEPGLSDVTFGGEKWIVGLRWEEIDRDWVLRHRLSKSLRGRDAVKRPSAGKTEWYDLRVHPLVWAELRRLSGVEVGEPTRDMLPASGPVVVRDDAGLPWTRNFSQVWRRIARAAGVPDEIRNKDSRAGAASEARLAGASTDDVRATLAHEDPQMTETYSRANLELRRSVMAQRNSLRKRTGNDV